MQGEMVVPGDKSISHRSIMFGALAEGTTHVSGFLAGEDCLATINAFRQMGVSIDGPTNNTVTIRGVGMHGLQAPTAAIDLGNSGTSIRLLSGILAAQPFNSILTGDASLSKRPMGRIATPLNAMGAKIHTQDGTPPLHIEGNPHLHAITYNLPVASAQLKSAILLAGMYADGVTVINECGISRDHTERFLQGFGYPLDISQRQIRITGGGQLQALDSISIPADISSAAFFIVAASITPGADLTLKHVGVNPTRTGILSILKMMGADITLNNQRMVGAEPVADIHVKYAPLRAIDVPVDLVPLAIDEFPAICIAAACAEGITTVHGAAELRVKESDRIQAMVDGLQTLGIETHAFSDGLSIKGGIMRGGQIDSQHDHRIAMAFSIAGAVSADPIEITECDNVATSFPNFVELANAQGLSIKIKGLED